MATKPEHLAFNIWLSLLDELLEKHVPIATGMMYAGQRLQEKQNEHDGTLFHPVDLYHAIETVNLLLRRRPEYAQRSTGWAQSKRWGKDD